jgi:peptidoglycan/LPS O-acetylase OafA/YrhL
VTSRGDEADVTQVAPAGGPTDTAAAVKRTTAESSVSERLVSLPDRPSAGRRHYRLLEPVRAVAALMVVGYHSQSSEPAGFLEWDIGETLNTGVAVFFVLSGFLLYRPFLSARLNGAAQPSFRHYLMRRFLRVIPAYWVAITVFGLTLPVFVPVFGPDWWVFYSLTQTAVPGRVFDGLAPAWSLSVEASFYLGLPLYVAMLRRLVGRRPIERQVRIEAALLVLVTLSTLAARRLLFDRGEGPTGFLVWSILGHLDWFAVGLGLALASVLYEGAAERPWIVRIFASRPTACWAAAWFVIALLGFLRGSPGDIVHVVSMVIAILMIAPVVFGDGSTGLVRRLLGCRPMIWFGTVSYGIFLWNEPIASVSTDVLGFESGSASGFAVVFLVTATAAIVTGAASYYLIERPAMALPRGLNQRKRPVPTT